MSAISYLKLGAQNSPLFVFEKRAQVGLRKARLSTACIIQQPSSPRPLIEERKHPLPCLTDTFVKC